MKRRILILIGNPARKRISFCEALGRAYAEGAKEGGHTVRLIKIADLSFDPILHEGYHGQQEAEQDILLLRQYMLECDHWVIVYPLWQFMIPALLKGFFERCLTQGFAYDLSGAKAIPLLKGKSARLVQTMGMPAFAYKWIFGRHAIKSLISILHFIGLGSIRTTYCGLVENPSDKRREGYLLEMRALGKKAL